MFMVALTLQTCYTDFIHQPTESEDSQALLVSISMHGVPCHTRRSPVWSPVRLHPI